MLYQNKKYMSAKGGITKGKSHAEGGIPMVVESTGQQVELEGGEGVINKRNMASTKTFDFEGKKMTICEIASKINSSDGNGVQIDCDNVTGTKYKYAKGGKILNEDEEESFKEWMDDGNVISFEKDVYSTQDAQYRNRLKGMDELRKYFRKEFLSDSYSEGGNVNEELKMDYDFRSLLLPNEKQFFLQNETKGIEHKGLIIFTDGKREIVFSRYKTKLKKLGNASNSTKALYDKYFADGGYVDLETYNFNELRGKYVNLYSMGVELPTENQIVDVTLSSPQFRYRYLTLKFDRGNAQIKFNDIEDFLNEEIVYVKTDKEEFGVQLIPNQFAKGGRTKNAMKLDDYENASVSMDSYEDGAIASNPTEFANGGGVDSQREYLEKRLWNERGYDYAYLNKLSVKELRSLYDTEFYYDEEFKQGGVVDEIKTKYQIAGSDKYGVYTYSKRVADEIANMYGGDVQEDGSKWYVRLDETYEGGGGVGNVYIALSKTKNGLLLSERFDKQITHKQLFDYYKKKGYEIIDSNIFKVTNKGVLDVFKDAISKFIKEKYNELVDWQNTLLSYEIVGDRIIAQSCFVQTKNGNEYKITPNDLVNKKFAKGGGVDLPKANKMFHLPLELAVYVPSTQDVDKVISDSELKERVDEVSEYLARLFGGFTKSDKIGGFMSSKSELVTEDVVPVVSFATKDDFNANKDKLVNKLSEWAKRWGQEAIGFEFEGDLYYVPESFANGGNIKKIKYGNMTKHKYAEGGRVRYYLNGFEESLNYILNSTNGKEVRREGSKENGDLVIYFETTDEEYAQGGGIKHSYEITQEGNEFIVEFLKSNGELDWGRGGFSSREEAEKYALENRRYAKGGGVDNQKVFEAQEDGILGIYSGSDAYTIEISKGDRFATFGKQDDGNWWFVKKINVKPTSMMLENTFDYRESKSNVDIDWQDLVLTFPKGENSIYAEMKEVFANGDGVDGSNNFYFAWADVNYFDKAGEYKKYHTSNYIKAESKEKAKMIFLRHLENKIGQNEWEWAEEYIEINPANDIDESIKNRGYLSASDFGGLSKDKFSKGRFAKGGGVGDNYYRISISENDKYIGEYPHPIESLMDAKTIFVQLANQYKRPQYLISVSRRPTSSSGYEKINVNEWYDYVEGFAKGGDVRDMSWYQDFKKQELKRGTEHEMEHIESIKKFKKKGVSDREVAKAIAKDHLDENENYYIELEKMQESSEKVSNALQDFEHQKSKRKSSRKYKLGGYMGDNKSVNVHIKLTKDHEAVVRSKDGTYLNDVNLKKDKVYKFGFLFDEGQNVAFDLGDSSDSYMLIPSNIVVVVGYDEEKMELGGEVKSYADYNLDRNDKSILKLLLNINPRNATAEQRDKVSTFKGNNIVNDLSPKLIQKIYGILFQNHNVDNKILNLYITNIGVGNIVMYAPSYLHKTMVGFDEKNQFVQVEKEIANIVTEGKRRFLFNEFELSDMDGFIHVYPKSNPEVDTLCGIFYKTKKKAVAVGVCEFTSREKLDAFQRSIGINQGSMALNQMISFAKSNDYLIVNEGITSEGAYTLIYTMTKY